MSADRQQAARPRWHAVLLSFALLWFGLVSGCVTEATAPLWADPGVARVDISRVSRPEVEVVIHNVSGSPRPIADFAFGGEDWGSLRFVDDSLPRSIAADDSVVVRLAASPAGFRVGPSAYRSGRASLTFRSDQHEFEVPIELLGTAAQADGAPPAWLAIVVLALLGGVALLIPRVGTRPNLGPNPVRWMERLPLAGAIAGLLLLAAMIPVGSAYCAGRLGVRVGPAEVAQCRAGLGGFELTLLPATPGLWWWLIALTIAAGVLAVVRKADGATIALSLVRVLGFALILAALLIGLAPAGLAPSDLVFAQLRTGASVPSPSWGILAQPLACAAGFALAVALPMLPMSGPTPVLERLARLERLLWSALLTTVCLGGWTIPGLSDRAVPRLAHAGTLGAELFAFTLKLALVYLALTRLGEHLRARQISPSMLLRTHARWTMPLIFANLIAVVLWRVFQ